MGYARAHVNPDGVRMLLDSDALSLCERIQKGDPTCGWSGDERMYVAWNPQRNKYEVHRAAESGRDYLISSWFPGEFDSRVLRSLAEGDLRTRDVLGQIDKHNARIERQREEEMYRMEQELKRDTQWMARKLYLPDTDPAPYTGSAPNRE